MNAKAKKKMAPKVVGGNGSKDPSPVEENPLGLTGPVIDEETGGKSFSKHDLMVLELSQHRVVNATQAARLKKHEVDDFQRSANQKLTSLQSIKLHLDGEARKREEEHRALQAAISQRYQVDLSKITYDDETGRITEPPPSVEEVPETPPAGTPEAAETPPAE